MCLNESNENCFTGAFHPLLEGEAETSRVLLRLHQRAFLEWLAMTVTQQSRDLTRFLSSAESNTAKVNLDPRELLASLPPAEARPEELNMFTRDLGPMLDQVWPKTAADILAPVAAAAAAAIHTAPIERIA